ncbi:hypothetical protein [Vibrio algarum]|uniref:Uncharacterized protein n=1 Tax=Vibrio algarum TaxID=3020714 RepID=A0ABT4YN58_9VIBR|nr:hypothetical protein [Vibrio sp. KJ40-1]MDB1122837.1 hypothetical protein [Vibrio sp. KJ40-1]
MSIRLIRPEMPDFPAHCEIIKPAFDGAPYPKLEHSDIVERVQGHHASFYHFKGDGFSVRIIGQVTNDGYLLIISVGHGLAKCMPTLIDVVKKAGHKRLICHTYKKGMRRIYRMIGASEIERIEHKGGIVETIHALEI